MSHKSIIKNTIFLWGLLIAVLAWPAVTLADIFGEDAPVAKFSVDKTLCTGDLRGDPAAGTCPLAPQTQIGASVSYVFTVTSPWGQPPQLVTLSDILPSAFTPAGTIVCQDSSSNAVTLTSSGPAPVITAFQLDMNQTVTCVLAGSFSATGTVTNEVNAENNSGYKLGAQVNTDVRGAPQPLGSDLSIIKQAASPQVSMSSGTATLSYRYIIKNNGPTDVFVGDHFTMRDTMSLLQNSIPFHVRLLGAACQSSNPSNTDCLDPSDIDVQGNPWMLVGTSGQYHIFDWAYSSGKGHLAAGEEIVLSVEFEVKLIEGIKCSCAAHPDSIRNTAFFTLVSEKGDALAESNMSNNTSSADIRIDTGLDDNCDCAGAGATQLKLNKVQIEPAPGPDVAWGQPVTYRIEIENTSVPPQVITIDPANLQDWVSEGINTPPFFRRHVMTNCSGSTDPADCAALNSGLSYDPDMGYTYYGQTAQAWSNTAPVELDYGHRIVLETTFVYQDPDCETVPAAPARPVINTARLAYSATEYGAVNPNGPTQTFSATSSATTNMRKVKACPFRVEKKIIDPTGADANQIKFGQGHAYEVTFTNGGAKREIGTVMDAIRLSAGGYSGGVEYTAGWSCTDNGVTGYAPSGTLTGNTLKYVSTPAHGSLAMQLRANPGQAIRFGSGASLTCIVKLEVQRPPLGSSQCLFDPVRLENMALMDVTYPFNPNIHWPPSGSWSGSNGPWQQPSPQNVNWAIASAQMPQCIDAIINKEAEVVGQPSGSAPWNYAGGPAIDYTMTITNTGQGQYETPPNQNFNPFHGLVGDDVIEAPYATKTPASWNCSPTADCSKFFWQPLPDLGVEKLGSGQNMTWNLQIPGPFITNQDITNCASIDVSGDMTNANGDYYTNFASPVAKGPGNPSAQNDCVTIPIIATTRINLTKVIDDQTGAGITTGGPFTFDANCSPYQLFPGDQSITINAGQTGTFNNIPVFGSCNLVEGGRPPVPQAAINACGAGQTAVWGDVTFSPSATLSGSASSPLSLSPYNVTATNVLRCESGPGIEYVDLTLSKIMRNPGKTSWDFTYNITCSPVAANPSTLTVNFPDIPSGVVQVPVGSQCTIEEVLPEFTQEQKDYCAARNPYTGPRASLWGPVWRDPVYQPGASFTVGPKNLSVKVINSWSCGNEVPNSGTYTGPKGGMKPGGMGTLGGGQVLLRERPAGTWSNWFNMDRPGGNGDYEMIENIGKMPGACPVPTSIECRRASDKTPSSDTGETYLCDLPAGGRCSNAQQGDRRCDDYEVRVLCPKPGR